ncbi:MAG TPA: alpha/beta hydrolase [Anaerolineae bacterium]|nr:alpha/beta hydrolase [Anaerolineae bacterium]
MSSIVTSQGIVHYEAYGRGRPVILLHGWINSWGVWQEEMIQLAERGGYKVYALDFWGFGESAKAKTPPFRVASYVEMVDQFMETLGILRAPVLGHSMGGTVALRLALEKPERVTRVVVVGSPIDGRSLNFFLKLAGINWIAHTVWRAPLLLRLVILANTLGDSERVRKMILRDVEKTSVESFFRSIGDLHYTDLRQPLHQLGIPALGIYGKSDNIVNPNQGRVLVESVQGAQVQMMDRSRHFVMLDEPEAFHHTVYEFLKS